MTDTPRIGSASLGAAIDGQIQKLLAMKLPSLRVVHSARPQIVRLDYNHDRETPLILKAGSGDKLHPGHRELALGWIDVLQTVLQPAVLLELKAKVKPSKKALHSQAAAHFAATVLAVSNWPANAPWPEGADLCAVMRAQVRRQNREPVADAVFELYALNDPHGSLKAIAHQMPALVPYLGYYWSRCSSAIAPWLADGGITDIAIEVPIVAPGSLSTGAAVPGSSAVH